MHGDVSGGKHVKLDMGKFWSAILTPRVLSAELKRWRNYPNIGVIGQNQLSEAGARRAPAAGLDAPARVAYSDHLVFFARLPVLFA